MLGIAGLRVISALVVLSTGFRALSDDDYSRLVIAQGFAQNPSLDPSGTSWLPLPFWITGGCMQLFGATIEVARTLSFLSCILVAVAIHIAGGWLGWSVAARRLGAVVGVVLPHAAILGVATIPDLPTAALIVLAAASTVSDSVRVRRLGALCAGLACLCRYEAWPVALVVAVLALFKDAASPGEPRPRGRDHLASVLALVPPVLWMVNGAIRHGSPLFFLHRVSAYQRALGGEQPSFLARLLRQPISLFSGEPEFFVAGLGLLVLLVVVLRSSFQGLGRATRRFWLVLGSVLVFLMFGDVLGGAPTHHEQRVLLSLWLGFGLWLAEPLVRALTAPDSGRGAPRAGIFLSGGRRTALFAAVLGVASLGVALSRLAEPPQLRSELRPGSRLGEQAMGRMLKSALPPGEKVALLTSDYGYFAMQAALSRPGASRPLLDRDPRRGTVEDPRRNPEALRRALTALGARWLVVPATDRQAMPDWLAPRAQTGGFVLLAVR